MMVERLFLAVPGGCLQFVIVVFPDHTHLLFNVVCAYYCQLIGLHYYLQNNCFHVENMKQLFQDINIDSIMTFLRQINHFNKI